MKEGTLVRVRWGGVRKPGQGLGEVVRYEPDHHGGSAMITSRWGMNSRVETTCTPRRGRVLVLLYEDGGMSWWDEATVEVLGVKDGT